MSDKTPKHQDKTSVNVEPSENKVKSLPYVSPELSHDSELDHKNEYSKTDTKGIK